METLQKYYLTFNLVLIIHEQLAHCSLRDVSLIWVHLRWQLTNTLTSVRFQFTRCVHCTYGALQMFIVRTVHFRCSLYVRCTSDVHCTYGCTSDVHCTYGALQMFIVRTVHFRCSLWSSRHTKGIPLPVHLF